MTVVADAVATPPRRRAELVAALRTPLYRDGLVLMGNAALTSVLGLAYWAIAARLVSPAVIGVNTALVAAMMAISNVGQLSLGGALVSFMPRLRGRRGRFVARCYVMAAAASVTLALMFVLVAPHVVHALGVLRTPWVAATFVLAVVVWSVFGLQDNALTALRQTFWIPLENVAYSSAKLISLAFVAGGLAGVGIFVSWIVPAAVALVPVNLLLFRRLLRREADEPVVGTPPTFGRFVALDSLGMLLSQISSTLLPVLVIARVGASAAGTFAIPWLLVQSVDLVAISMGMSLTVEGSQHDRSVRPLLASVQRRVLAVLGVGAAGGALAAPFVLAVYGHGYSSGAPAILRILLIAALPRAIVILAVCAARAELRPSRVVAVQAVLAVAVPVAAWILMGMIGVEGAALGWLVAQVIALPFARDVVRP